MPTIYRTMKRAADGLPVVGSNSSTELGVRLPPNQRADIDLDPNGHVVQNGRGMSVVANWRHLLAHQIPKRLKTLFPGAVGNNSLACYRMGEGDFADGVVTNDLHLVLKPGRPHAGNVVPDQSVHYSQLQSNLAATRNQWSVDET
jgi:hypothetical protein